jgi:hypothetical protein
VLIEQAKGVLMASEKVDAQTAFNRLRRQARNTRRPVPEVAREIVDSVWGSPNYRRPATPGRSNEAARGADASRPLRGPCGRGGCAGRGRPPQDRP